MSEIILKRKKQMNVEREAYHKFLDKFKLLIKKGSLIYDIGKSSDYDYNVYFSEFNYKSIDYDEKLKPDIIMDVEKYTNTIIECDALICNGVVELCNNPYSLFEGVYKLLKKDGIGLFGIMLVGYPLYKDVNYPDYVRFTPKGVVDKLLNNFSCIEKEIVYRNEIPSYFLAICKK